MTTKTISKLILMLLVSIFAGRLAMAVEPRTEHTYQLGDGEERPAATLQDASFLVGSWTGTAFGQRFEEVWNAPSAGSMVGMFKLYDGDEVAFYEILLLSVQDGTLSLKVKHFSADFTAWEDKEDFVNFRLVSVDDDELHFSGISFYKRDGRNLDAYIVMRNGAEISEHQLTYLRQD